MKNNSGVSLIATVLTLLIFSLFIAIAVSLVTTGSNISVQEEQGTQAFSIADGGLHYTLAKNNTNVPNYSTNGTWIPLGAGEFKVDTPAYLDGGIAAGAGTITVDSTAAFPAAGRITIGTDFGIIYTGKNATQFTGTSGGQAHNDHDSVYPATKLSTAISAANCDDLAAIAVDNDTGGFYISRPFFIDEEYFLCATKTQYEFQNCKRCYLGSSRAAHNTTRYASQYILTSTGRITNVISSNVQRVVQISAGPKEN